MTSHFWRGDERSMFRPETPYFFKIILEKTILDGKLGIPRKFVKKYGNGMPNKALLQVPSGAAWQVELSKSDGRIWLQKGWQEFAEYYSLRRGHFLVFRYERKNGHFHVLIFDMSASEIEYPFTELPDLDKNFDSESEDQLSMEILEDIDPRSEKTREKSPIQSTRPRKMMKTNTTRGIVLENVNEHTSLSPYKQSFSGVTPCERIQRSMDINGPEFQELAHHILRFRQMTAKDKAKALQIANAFKSENPFFLIIIDQMSYISHKYSIGIPASFARKYLKKTLTAEAILCLDSDGKTWSAKYSHTYDGKTRTILLWREFVLDNNLEAGDVCCLELLKGTNIVSFKVVIHRAFKNAKCYLSQQVASTEKSRASNVDCKGRRLVDSVRGNMDRRLRYGEGPAEDGGEGCHEDAITFASKYPYFKRTMRLTHLTSQNAGVPYEFIENYFEPNVSEVMLQVADRLWPVTLKRYPKRCQCKLQGGFTKFAIENSLKLGDVCVFERIALSNAVLKVSIFRHGR